MNDFSWIYILIFVVAPIIKNVVQARANKAKAKAEAEKKRFKREIATRPIEDHRSNFEPLSEELLTEAELEEDVLEWIQVPSPPSQSSSPPGGSSPLVMSELFQQLQSELGRADQSSIGEEDHDSLEPTHSRGPSRNHPKAVQFSEWSTPVIAKHGHRGNRRRKLTRQQLRDRLIWREILGPPVSLRKPD